MVGATPLKKPWWIRTLLALMVLVPYVACTVLASRAIDEPSRLRTSLQHFVSGTCSAWRDVAVIYGPQSNHLKTIPYPKTATPTLFRIQAHFREAYVSNGCLVTNGPLPPPDPKIVPYLNTQSR